MTLGHIGSPHARHALCILRITVQTQAALLCICLVLRCDCKGTGVCIQFGMHLASFSNMYVSLAVNLWSSVEMSDIIIWREATEGGLDLAYDDEFFLLGAGFP